MFSSAADRVSPVKLKTSEPFRRLRTKRSYVAYNDQQKRLLFRLKIWAVAWVGWICLRLWFLTCRMHVIGKEHFDAFQGNGRPVIYGMWHQGIVYLFYHNRGIRAAILSSRSNDGQLASELIRRGKGVPICGSSSRGGRAALSELAEMVELGHLTGVLVDGPRGPRRQCKIGVVRLAQKTGKPLIPLVVSAKRKWVLRSWDRTILPKPFSPVVVAYGPPMYVSADLTREQTEAKRVEFEAALERIQAQADRYFDEQ